MLSTARRIAHHRSLLGTLTARELKARYRGSWLGFLWSLVNPLLLLGVYTLVFGFVLKRDLASTEPYALFLITGLFPWIWILTSLLEGTTSLVANAGLIRKAVFPIELLPLVSVFSNLVHFLLAVPIIAGALVVGRILGYEVGGWTFLALPLVIAAQLPMVAGLSLGLAALNVHFKDVRDLLANVLQLLFFLSPILYSLDSIPVSAVRTLVRLNPLTSFTLAYQSLLFSGELPEIGDIVAMAAVAGFSWCVGTWLFERLSDTVAEAV